MAEKIYDYSNKHSYDGIAPKENESLVPFLAHEVLKNYHQDIKDGIRKRNEGIIEDNFETWNIRGRKILVGFTAIHKDHLPGTGTGCPLSENMQLNGHCSDHRCNLQAYNYSYI